MSIHPEPCPACLVEVVDEITGSLCVEDGRFDHIEAAFVMCDNCGFQMAGPDRDQVIRMWNQAGMNGP